MDLKSGWARACPGVHRQGPAATIAPVSREGQRPAWQRFAIRLASTKGGSWFYVNVAPSIDRFLLRVSGGRVSSAVVFPVVMIETIGAKCGQRRRTPLVATRDGERVVVIASRGGDTRHPGWYYNLRAHPEVTAWFEGAERRYLAREAEGEERERLWRLAADLYPGYDTYQQRAGRLIPVMVLEPVA
jgi:deazaflavin-dependent oxidoreductase (nitroreductase family)